LPDMRNAAKVEIRLKSSGCHGVVNLHARPNQKPFCDDGHSESSTSWQYGGK